MCCRLSRAEQHRDDRPSGMDAVTVATGSGPCEPRSRAELLGHSPIRCNNLSHDEHLGKMWRPGIQSRGEKFNWLRVAPGCYVRSRVVYGLVL